MRSTFAQLLCFLFLLRLSWVRSGPAGLDATSVLLGADSAACSVPDHRCWDGYNCFATDDTCSTGKALYSYAGCGDCSNWKDANGDAAYSQLPLGTTFSPAPTFGVFPYFIYRLSRYVTNYGYNNWRTCQLWRAPSVQITVTCPTGYYTTVSTATCSDVDNNHFSSSANYDGREDSGWHDNDCCYNCYGNFYNHGHVCTMCAQWDRMPYCQAGCVLPTLLNGTVSVINSAGGLISGVYRETATINYACKPGYYLSTLTVAPLSANCTVAGNNTGYWTSIPSCKPGCPQLTLTVGTGTVSYVPNLPVYSPTGYVAQTVLAVFNCTSGNYLYPANYTYNCTGPNGVWDLGPSAPVCRKGCPIITTFTNGQVIYNPTTNLVTGVYRWTSVATFNCSTGFYLSTLTTTTTTDCNVTGSWTAIPRCLPGCLPITPFAHGQTIPYIPSQQVNSLYPQNTMAIFNCSAGYYLSTLTTVNSSICTWNGQWSFVPNCTNIGSFPNGNYTYTTSTTDAAYLDNEVYRQATVATFTCNFQYYLSTFTSSTTTYCNSSGYWTSVPICIIGCLLNDTQLLITNGALSSFVTALVAGPVNNYLYQTNDVVNYTCYGDYYLSSVSPAICRGGQWLGIPSCIAGCHLFASNDSTKSVYSNVSYSAPVSSSNPLIFNEGTIASFLCYNGSYLGGPQSATCLNGSWTNQPICLAGCFAAPTIPNMDTLTYTVETVPTPVLHVNATVARYTCKTLYQFAGTDSMTCLYGNWTYPLPACNAIPLLLTITKAAMTLSCIFLVIALGIIIGLTILLRDYSIETCLHLNEDFALLFAHLLILIFLNSVDLTDLCPAASAGIQYFITTSFLCMMIEAIHSFALLQNVISFGGVFDYPRLKNFIVSWFGGMIPTGITIAMRYDKYASTYSCYVNLGDEICLYIMGPIIGVFLLTVIITEAAAMGDWKLLPLVNRPQVVAAHVNQKAMALLVFLSMGSWFCGLLASYLNSPPIFSIGAGVNTAFGVLIIIFHFVGNPKLNNWFHQKVLKKCCKKKQLDPKNMTD